MKSLTKKLITNTIFAGLIGLGSPAYTQDQNLEKKENLEQINPFSNKDLYKFYYNIEKRIEGKTWTPLDVPTEYYGDIYARICNCSEESGRGDIFIRYSDLNNDGFYEQVWLDILVNNTSLEVIETFRFYPENKEMDYTLEFKRLDPSRELIKSKRIIKKEYERITPREAQHIEGDFIERVNKILKAQNDFSRFNTAPLDELLREEKIQWKVEWKEEKQRFVKTGFPIYESLTDEEIKKIEEVLSGN